jgi:hypothetical protein
MGMVELKKPVVLCRFRTTPCNRDVRLVISNSPPRAHPAPSRHWTFCPLALM